MFFSKGFVAAVALAVGEAVMAAQLVTVDYPNNATSKAKMCVSFPCFLSKKKKKRGGGG